MDFETRYNEEGYLFDVIGPRFRKQGWLNAYDLFAIVRWKANRAISKVAKVLVRVSAKPLDKAARELTADLAGAASPRDRFYILSDKWNLRLPMASAILTVLYPNDFTVYDVRACEMLGDFEKLAYRTGTEAKWQGYLEFKAAVEANTPPHLSLRDKDRYLWARSRHDGLERFIRRDFAAEEA